jgi:hypothetical protein
MADVDLNFIAEQQKCVLANASDLKTGMSAIKHQLDRIHLDIAALRAAHLEYRLDQIEKSLGIKP